MFVKVSILVMKKGFIKTLFENFIPEETLSWSCKGSLNTLLVKESKVFMYHLDIFFAFLQSRSLKQKHSSNLPTRWALSLYI